MSNRDLRKAAIETAIQSCLGRPVESTFDFGVLAKTFGALPVYADMGGALLIRPSGEVICVHSDQAWNESSEFKVETDPLWIARAYDACEQDFPSTKGLMLGHPPHMSKGLLKAALNSLLDHVGDVGDVGSSRLVTGDTLRAYCGAGTNWGEPWKDVKELLTQWDAAGFLRVLTDPETASLKDVCIELLYYIDGAGRHPQYLKRPNGPDTPRRSRKGP